MDPRHARLVEDLAARLEPVRPLPAPGLRAVAWLATVIGLGLLLALRLRMVGMESRMEEPDLWLSAFGAMLTAVTAAYAAFATSVPGRSVAWAFLPVPFAVLWIGASGLGCLRTWLSPDADPAALHNPLSCFGFLVCVSVPLSLTIVMMLRRACPLHPNLTAALAGLAVAAAAAALLVPFHPHETSMADIAVHIVVVSGVIGLNALAGGRLLSRDRT